jgi:hypothetical protein
MLTQVAVNKQWEFLAHPECLKWNLESSDEFSADDFVVKDMEVNGRTCVLCGRQLVYKAPEARPDFVKFASKTAEKVTK